MNFDDLNDTGLLDALQDLLDDQRYTGRCILRLSTRGRGFRLHETSLSKGVRSVRQAIRDGLARLRDGEESQ